jgi:hypothetical protein
VVFLPRLERQPGSPQKHIPNEFLSVLCREAEEGREKVVMGTAYAMARKDIPPALPDDGEWHILQFGMAIIGKDRCEKGLPGNLLDVLPSFPVVATDREAARKEMLARFDDMWDAWEEEKRNGTQVRNG